MHWYCTAPAAAQRWYCIGETLVLHGSYTNTALVLHEYYTGLRGYHTGAALVLYWY